MRHTVEVRLPRLFGKKKRDTETEVKTEIDLEDKDKSISAIVVLATPLLVGVTLGYLVGFKHGVGKGNPNVLVIRD